MKMRYDNELALLESEWSDTGFFWQVRDGRFNPVEFARTLDKIKTVTFAENAELPRRVVSLLWYIPLFMQWQIERVRETGGDVGAYEVAITKMTNEIERILGVP
jgi:hypothetical protein